MFGCICKAAIKFLSIRTNFSHSLQMHEEFVSISQSTCRVSAVQGCHRYTAASKILRCILPQRRSRQPPAKAFWCRVWQSGPVSKKSKGWFFALEVAFAGPWTSFPQKFEPSKFCRMNSKYFGEIKIQKTTRRHSSEEKSTRFAFHGSNLIQPKRLKGFFQWLDQSYFPSSSRPVATEASQSNSLSRLPGRTCLTFGGRDGPGWPGMARDGPGWPWTWQTHQNSFGLGLFPSWNLESSNSSISFCQFLWVSVTFCQAALLITTKWYLDAQFSFLSGRTLQNNAGTLSASSNPIAKQAPPHFGSQDKCN